MMVEWLTALEQLQWIAELRYSRWTYAAVNAGHIVGIALLFGAIVPLDLRLLGCWRSVPIGTLARVLVPIAAGGLVLAISAGLLLFATRASEYAALTLFWIKLALIFCGIGNALLLRKAKQWESSHAIIDAIPPPRLRAAGLLSIGLWLSVIVCGRMLAFVT
jgi:uncharacterized protein DUF6644